MKDKLDRLDEALAKEKVSNVDKDRVVKKYEKENQALQ